jgi:uncharacterized OB-fold protein
MVWELVGGAGEVHSWIVTHQPYGPAFVDAVPFVVALVRLDEQSDILIPGPFVSDGNVYQGLRVHAAPEPVTDTVGVITWEAEGDE